MKRPAKWPHRKTCPWMPWSPLLWPKVSRVWCRMRNWKNVPAARPEKGLMSFWGKFRPLSRPRWIGCRRAINGNNFMPQDDQFVNTFTVRKLEEFDPATRDFADLEHCS